jgi:hypothetical protein
MIRSAAYAESADNNFAVALESHMADLENYMDSLAVVSDGMQCSLGDACGSDDLDPDESCLVPLPLVNYDHRVCPSPVYGISAMICLKDCVRL